MTRSVHALVAVALAAGLALTAVSLVLSDSSADPDSRRVVGAFGLEAPLSLIELTQLADLVVIGTAVTDRVVPFTANSAIPPEERDRIYAKGAFHDLTLEVGEYLKGSGARAISIRWHASTPQLTIVSEHLPNLVTGTPYILFLERGRGVWVGGYTVLGSRGLGTVVNGDARFAAFGTLTLQGLRDTVRNVPPRKP